MDGVGARLLGRVEDLVDVEVALARRRRPDGIGLVGGAHVQRGAIGVGVDGDGGDAELAAGAHHAHGDLAAVRDQYFLDRARHVRDYRGSHGRFSGYELLEHYTQGEFHRDVLLRVSGTRLPGPIVVVATNCNGA